MQAGGLLAIRFRDPIIRRVKYISLLLILLLASCGKSFNEPIYTRKGTVGAEAGCCEIKTTVEQGIRDAQYDLAENEFHIFRYDMPPVRTGDWQNYYANFEEFGINEQGSIFNSLEYCNAYNAVMNKALKKKFGKKYLLKRDQILPPRGAKKFDFDQSK